MNVKLYGDAIAGFPGTNPAAPLRLSPEQVALLSLFAQKPSDAGGTAVGVGDPGVG